MERESNINKSILPQVIKVEKLAESYDHPEDFIFPDNKERALASGAQNFSGLLTERIIRNSYLDIPDAFIDNYKDAINEGYVPILVTNHTSHADAAVSTKLINLLIIEGNKVLADEEKMSLFSVPLAASLEMGQQGPLLRQIYLGAKPIIERYGFLPNLIVRPKDNRTPEEGGYNMKSNNSQYRKRYKQRLHGTRNGTLLYPEGTTEGGKIGANGLPKGMIPFEDISIPFHLLMSEKYTGRKPIVITAGITGSHNVIDANTKSAAWTRLLSSYLDPNQFILKVGEIIKTDAPEFQALGDNGKLNEFIGKKVASLLPPEMRGVYK